VILPVRYCADWVRLLPRYVVELLILCSKLERLSVILKLKNEEKILMTLRFGFK
jgi:hypothetical protein